MDQLTALRLFTIVMAAIALLASPALSQDFKPKRGFGPPQFDAKPKVDEKAYKAALDRIPTPEKPKDPWAVARPPEAEGAAKKPN